MRISFIHRECPGQGEVLQECQHRADHYGGGRYALSVPDTRAVNDQELEALLREMVEAIVTISLNVESIAYTLRRVEEVIEEGGDE